ncbi:hypothetical protein SVIOM342S_02848 [Streptomyces violaceorubidus]
MIAWQVWKYGAAQFPDSALGRYFRPLFGLFVAVALSVNYHAFIDLADPDGEYTGFGINLMMSILYIKMLEDRGSPAGQSMYIALGKWLGTLCAGSPRHSPSPPRRSGPGRRVGPTSGARLWATARTR